MSKDLTQYMPLLHKIAGAFPKQFRDDLVQEGYLILVRADELYNDTSGASFETYATKSVFRHMRKYVEKFTNTVSLDNPVEDEDGGTTTFADLLVDEDTDVEKAYSDRDYYEKNIEQSTPIERFIKERHYEEGMTAQEIVELYYELHMISDVRTIKRILKK